MRKKFAKSKYSEKLLDPRWQKKRLDILNRDGFECRVCCDNESTLHVHHCFYRFGAEPLDYPDSSLITLCESCHDMEKDSKVEKQALINSISRHGFLAVDFNSLSDAFYHADLVFPNEVIISLLGWVIKEPHLQEILFEGFCNRNKKLKEMS